MKRYKINMAKPILIIRHPDLIDVSEGVSIRASVEHVLENEYLVLLVQIDGLKKIEFEVLNYKDQKEINFEELTKILNEKETS